MPAERRPRRSGAIGAHDCGRRARLPGSVRFGRSTGRSCISGTPGIRRLRQKPDRAVRADPRGRAEGRSGTCRFHTTSPPNLPNGSPAPAASPKRHSLINSMLEEAARRHPKTVSVLDIDQTGPAGRPLQRQDERPALPVRRGSLQRVLQRSARAARSRRGAQAGRLNAALLSQSAPIPLGTRGVARAVPDRRRGARVRRPRRGEAGPGAGWQPLDRHMGREPAGCDAREPFGAGFRNATIREIVLTSAGGARVRVRLTNAYGSGALRIGLAAIAVDRHGPDTVPGTSRAVYFDHRRSVVIAPGGEATSDPERRSRSRPRGAWRSASSCRARPGPRRNTPPPSRSITSRPEPSPPTAGARSRSGRGRGTCSTASTCSAPSAHLDRWSRSATRSPTASVRAGQERALAGLHLAARLNARSGATLAVIDEGIGGNRVLNSSLCCGVDAVARFARDVGDQPGARGMPCNPARGHQRHRVQPESRSPERAARRRFRPADRPGLRAHHHARAHGRTAHLRGDADVVRGRALLDTSGRGQA